jgi:response regulator RpfG family c-di-GMP phosphodiesterase
MTVSHESKSAQKTVLVVNSDVAVLLLMRGILQNDYRVLLAADAKSAAHLLTIDGLRIDLAVVDRNVRSSGKGGLRRRLMEILPQTRILSMAGWVQDGVIRLHALGVSNTRTSDSLLQRISIALAEDEPERKVMCAGRCDASTQITPEVTFIAIPKVMTAGHGID